MNLCEPIPPGATGASISVPSLYGMQPLHKGNGMHQQSTILLFSLFDIFQLFLRLVTSQRLRSQKAT